MNDFYPDFLLPYQQPEQDPYKDLPENERIHLAVYQAIAYIATFIITLFICSLFSGCTTPKIIEHHHHHYQADTLALQAQANAKITDTRTMLDSLTRSLIDQYSASWFSHDEHREHITETITTYIDSLGREVRQEQRTTDRSLSKMQQQSEQRLSKEFEHRLRVAVDSINGIWQQRFNALQAHHEQADSSSVQRGFPASESIPWYKRWWYTLQGYLLIIAVGVLLLLTHRIWWPLCKVLFRKILER